MGSGVNGLTPGPLRLLGQLSPAGQGPAADNTRLPLPSLISGSASGWLSVIGRAVCYLLCPAVMGLTFISAVIPAPSASAFAVQPPTGFYSFTV